MTNEMVDGASVGVAARCSNANWSPDTASAQWTGFSLSISAHGIPSIISGMAGFASSGHTYAAMAIPEVRNVMRRTVAISLPNDEKNLRIRCEKVIAASVAHNFCRHQPTRIRDLSK
ncbi:hypothetical protein [Noviherbaspirillum malthae]|uniref:hypothetical protein n=1 Tax=Noviherbaspirillum malthae TaxID=1260987 RepID=UPI00188E424F|nr:hypothetical protein [Noviherbaspirillum malthae]